MSFKVSYLWLQDSIGLSYGERLELNGFHRRERAVVSKKLEETRRETAKSAAEGGR